MSCPACGAPRIAGHDRCGGCGAMLMPPVEGALAPNPALARDVPGLRRRVEREKNWKDEVRERVRHRKQEKAKDRRDEDLPLFRNKPPDTPQAEPDAEPEAEPEATTLQAEVAAPIPEMSLGEPAPEELGRYDPYGLTEEIRGTGAGEAYEEDDLPLNRAPSAAPVELPRARVVDDEPENEPENEPETETEIDPVERPAFLGERARAAGIDLLFVAVLWSVVVYFAYFAGRGAQAGTAQLLHTWPWLVGYLSFLGLTYAAYFTGTTGQTLGKILGELRVVDTGGRPPGYVRAFVRAGIGGLGVLLAGVGLAPMLVDPARRAFHDKLLGTRVVRK